MAVLTAVGLQSALVPIGAIIHFGGTVAPTGYLTCDGTAISRSTFAALFAAIGTTWGVGDGSTTFNLPDLRRAVDVGSGGTGTGVLANTVGSKCTAESVTLTTTELPSHTHAKPEDMTSYMGQASGAPINLAATAGETLTTRTGDVQNTGSGGAFSIMQTSAVVLKCIRYE